MEKKHTQPKQKSASLKLRTETLRQLDNAKLKAVAGGVRAWTPTGVATPIEDDTAG